MRPSAPVCVLHHHIGEATDCEDGLGVATARAAYEAQIDRLLRDYTPIDLTTLLSGRLPPRPLLFTFDDNYRSVLDAAREVLHPRGIPAVLFVNPGLLGARSLALDNTVAWAARTVGLKRLCDDLGIAQRESISEVIGRDLAMKTVEQRMAIRDQIVRLAGRPEEIKRSRILETDELRELIGLGIEIGNHTMSHSQCRTLTGEELRSEIVGAKEKIEAITGQEVRAFSVPYGNSRDLTEDVLRTARESGHKAIFLVHARSNARRPAPDIWYRTSLHNEEPGVLDRKLVYLPALRSWKARVFG